LQNLEDRHTSFIPTPSIVLFRAERGFLDFVDDHARIFVRSSGRRGDLRTILR
jgi:hypothetical protein